MRTLGRARNAFITVQDDGDFLWAADKSSAASLYNVKSEKRFVGLATGQERLYNEHGEQTEERTLFWDDLARLVVLNTVESSAVA